MTEDVILCRVYEIRINKGSKMKQNSVARKIMAPVSAVWAILTDKDALVRGNTGVTRIEGEIKQGTKITLWNQVAPNQAFKISISQLTPNQSMTWESGMPFKVFYGRRVFTVQADGDGTLFTMTETYTGMLLPLMWRVMPDLAPSFEIFADGVKRMAEGDPQ